MLVKSLKKLVFISKTGIISSVKAVFIVSRDKDLLSLESYKDVEIITAADFCSRYLN